MSEFTAGFASRHAVAADLLRSAFALPEGFAPRDVRASAAAIPPRHFSPADRASNPTGDWNPLDSNAPLTPFIDPLTSAHAAGYAEGLAAATDAGRDGASRDEALMAGLAAALKAGTSIDRDHLAQRIRQTVLHLVGRIVGDAGIAPALFTARIEAATEMLADSSESALLRCHPDDVALLTDSLPKTVFAVGDASIARGSFVLESASTVIEDGPDLWLEQLAHAIERVPVPPAC